MISAISDKTDLGTPHYKINSPQSWDILSFSTNISEDALPTLRFPNFSGVGNFTNFEVEEYPSSKFWTYLTADVLNRTGPETETESDPAKLYIRQEFEQMIKSAQFEQMVDEFESTLSRRLTEIVTLHNEDSIYQLRRVLEDLQGTLTSEVLGETLRTLGRINHPLTQGLRLSLLSKFLHHTDILVRDAAGIGLSLLGDKNAIGSLNAQINRETNSELRDDLIEVVSELRGLSDAFRSEEA